MKHMIADKKGFTLLETIVALAVAGIFMLCAAMIIVPILQVYSRVSAVSDAQLIAGNVLDVIRKEAAYAPSLASGMAGEKPVLDLGDGRTITLSDEGYLTVGEQAYFAPSYYRDKTLALTCEQAGKNQVNLVLSVYQDGRQLCTVEGTIATLRNVLTRSYSIYEPEGMRQIALEVAAKQSGRTPNDDAYWELYREVYGGAMPEYALDNILSRERRQAMYEQALAAYGPYSPTTRRYKELLDNTYYLAVGITKQTLIPIVYVTNNVKQLESQTHTSVSMIYYDGVWYFPVKGNGYYLPQFNGRSDDEITAALADQTQWIPASQLR